MQEADQRFHEMGSWPGGLLRRVHGPETTIPGVLSRLREVASGFREPTPALHGLSPPSATDDRTELVARPLTVTGRSLAEADGDRHSRELPLDSGSRNLGSPRQPLVTRGGSSVPVGMSPIAGVCTQEARGKPSGFRDGWSWKPSRAPNVARAIPSRCCPEYLIARMILFQM